MKALTLLLLVTALPCHAQIATTTPTIKGHTLGESLKQFIAESNSITHEQMQKCQAGSTGKNVDSKFSDRCDAFLHTLNASPVSGSFDCAGAVEANSGYDADFIKSFIDGANLPCFELIGRVTFENDKLVKFDLNFMNQPWEEVLPDIIAKFGKPTEKHIETVQNAYGAKFDLQRTSWITPQYIVVAFEKLNLPYSLVKLVEVHITDHKYFDEQKSKQLHANALD